MVDIWGEGVPNWIMAVSTLLTLGVAGVAAFFAYKAAHWTKDQAEASRDQAKYAREALDVAQRDSELATETSEHQRAEADRSYRLLVQAQLDALMPVVLATAEPGDPGPEGFYLWARRDGGGSGGNAWAPVTETLEIPRGERYWFRFTAELSFQNISGTVARINIVNNAGGKFLDHTEGSMPSLVVPPYGERALTWTRFWPSDGLYRDGAPHDPETESLNMNFLVRDQGLNVRDTYEFLADLRFFSKDGSRLIVKSQQAFPWRESVASPLPGRGYERLDW